MRGAGLGNEGIGKMNERIRINDTSEYATKAEVQAHHDGEMARAKSATSADRMATQDELTARINERIRGIEYLPGVLISRPNLGTLRAHLRAYIQTADYAGRYDFKARHPGMN